MSPIKLSVSGVSHLSLKLTMFVNLPQFTFSRISLKRFDDAACLFLFYVGWLTRCTRVQQLKPMTLKVQTISEKYWTIPTSRIARQCTMQLKDVMLLLLLQIGIPTLQIRCTVLVTLSSSTHSVRLLAKLLFVHLLLCVCVCVCVCGCGCVWLYGTPWFGFVFSVSSFHTY